MSRRASGSKAWPSVVDPTMSVKTTVTILRAWPVAAARPARRGRALGGDTRPARRRGALRAAADPGEHRQQALGARGAARRAGDRHVGVADELLKALVARD